ncbi:Thioredoxin protein [Salix suchowensis]|nr:Thioredoxin protein [Salix suchowensis]
MNIQVSSISSTITRIQQKSSSSRKPPFCSSRKSQEPNQNGDTNGDKSSTDWDKAWSNFRKKGKKTFFSQFSPNKYVTWNPKRSNYPLSEEVDPIKRTERSNLRIWTGPEFTLVGAIIIVTVLLVYTILAPAK